MTFAELKSSNIGIAEKLDAAILEIHNLEGRLIRIKQIIGEANLAGSAVVQASMQNTSCILLHASARSEARFPGLFVDTGVHFPQTLELIGHYRREVIEIIVATPDMSMNRQTREFGRVLHLHDENNDDDKEGKGYQTCCHLRKRLPLEKAMKAGQYRFALSGLRRAEGLRRADLRPTYWDDAGEFLRIHPLFDWTDQEVQDYIHDYRVRTNELYNLGYTSIGCFTCTTPTHVGESRRAGRWRHLQSSGGYCGINAGEGDPSI